jgi:hypothetical protein
LYLFRLRGIRIEGQLHGARSLRDVNGGTPHWAVSTGVLEAGIPNSPKIASCAVRSPTFPELAKLEHDLSSLATPGTEACNAAGGAFRLQSREWPASRPQRWRTGNDSWLLYRAACTRWT